MSDEVRRRDTIDSPCIKLCVVDPGSRLCTGCLRSLDEIAEWGRMTPEARRAVMAELPSRSIPAPRRRGGRAGRLARTGGKPDGTAR